MRGLSSKKERIINVVEVFASLYMLTLILSFVLSDLYPKSQGIKLKMFTEYLEIPICQP